MNPSIDKYICDLLFYHDKVIVPGLGCFTTKICDTIIHPTQHTFIPPQKKIYFDIAEKSDNPVIAFYISKMEKKPLDEISKLLKAYIDSINTNLQKKESVEFKNIGKLTFDIEKNLKFDQDYSFNYNRNSFGLDTIQFAPLKRLNLKEKVEAKIQKNKLRAKKIKKIKIISLSIGSAVAAVSLILFVVIRFELFAGISMPSFKLVSSNEKKETLKHTENKEEQKYNKFALELFKAKQKKYLDSVTKQKYATTTVKPETQKTTKEIIPEKTKINPSQNYSSGTPNGHFHLVAGTFNVLENAKKFVDDLKQKGFANAKIINPQQRVGFKVIYGSYLTKSEANNELLKVQAAENKGAWLLIQ